MDEITKTHTLHILRIINSSRYNRAIKKQYQYRQRISDIGSSNPIRKPEIRELRVTPTVALCCSNCGLANNTKDQTNIAVCKLSTGVVARGQTTANWKIIKCHLRHRDNMIYANISLNVKNNKTIIDTTSQISVIDRSVLRTNTKIINNDTKIRRKTQRC